jgi:hypothetical protein
VKQKICQSISIKIIRLQKEFDPTNQTAIKLHEKFSSLFWIVFCWFIVGKSLILLKGVEELTMMIV